MGMEAEKRCTKCGETKPLDEFHKDRSQPDGRCPRCKVCKKRAARKYFRANQEERVKYGREYKAKNPEKIRACTKKYYEANREKILRGARVCWLKTQYNLTPEEYQAILDKQGGGCAICGRKRKPGEKHLHVDHRQDPWLIRGILCNNCNPGLGKFRHNSALTARATEYLREHGE